MASTSNLEPLSTTEESPNWLEMPHELMENILERLGDAEILKIALKVCTTWWRICKNPAKWKVINMHKPDGARGVNYDLEALTKQAVHLSCGELIDISLEGFGNDDLLDYIVVRSSKLNSLSLTNCCNITSSGLSRACEKLPQLEKLHISYTFGCWLIEKIGVIVPNWPQLKSLKLDKLCMRDFSSNYDALAIAKNMPELRHLQLYGNAMSNIGLQAILDGCPHLESLDIRTCYCVSSYGNNAINQCIERIRNFKGPDDSIENCGIRPRIMEYVESDDCGCIYPSDDQEDSDYEYFYSNDPYDDVRFDYM